MHNLNFQEQQHLLKFERSLHYIRSIERLSLEASIEELCKLLLLQICIEQDAGHPLSSFESFLTQKKEEGSNYQMLFERYVPSCAFRGWEQLRLSGATIFKVMHELTSDSIFEEYGNAKARAFSAFLQMHYSGYLSEYSTPQVLNDYIMDVINPDKVYSLADPCCGLGGMIAEAVRRSTHVLQVKGYDINQRMSNTANLHLMMYGYKADTVECINILEKAYDFTGSFEMIVSHLPYRRHSFRVDKRITKMTEKTSLSNQEDIFISHILKMLKPDGIAAIVVSDDLLLSEHRVESRRWLYENVKVLNISRFDGLTYTGGSNIRSYNVLFLRKRRASTSTVCSLSYFNAGIEESEIRETAKNLRDIVLSDVNKVSPKNGHTRLFHLSQEDSWNVNLLFAREKMGGVYETRLLKDLVIHDRQRVEVHEAKIYDQLTVKNKGLGVVERKGKYIGRASSRAVRYIARSGQLIISSLEADKGAVGIVPASLDGTLVSSYYYLFTIVSQEVDPDYLMMVLSSEPVLRQLGVLKRGTIMPRISIERLLSLVIPLPSLNQQKALTRRLTDAYNMVRRAQDNLEIEQREFASRLFGGDLI